MSNVNAPIPAARRRGAAANGRGRERFSVTLSPAAAKAFHDLKQATDADTDSEVFRNALRLHIALLRAYRDGKKLYLEDDQDKTLVPVSLFAPATDASP
jgi:hypothetical protein